MFRISLSTETESRFVVAKGCGDRKYGLSACVLSHFSCIQPFATLWTIAHQAPLSMGFSRREYWSGLLCPSPGRRDQTCVTYVSCIRRQVLYHLRPPGKPQWVEDLGGEMKIFNWPWWWLYKSLNTPELMIHLGGLPSGPVVKNPPANAVDMGSIPGPGRLHMPRGN